MATPYESIEKESVEGMAISHKQLVKEEKNTNKEKEGGQVKEKIITIPGNVIKIKRSEGHMFEVNSKIVRLSKTIRDMRKELKTDTIELPGVTDDILKMVIEWADYHIDDPPLVSEEERLKNEYYEQRMHVCDSISEWDIGFLLVDQQTIFQLMYAADYLNIDRLLDVIFKTVASMIKDKSPEDIRTTFNIKNDLAVEEVAKITEVFQWCKD